MCINQKDLQPTEYDGSIPLFMEKKPPSGDMLQSFDLCRVSLLPKNEDGLKKDKKACFALKSVGSTMRTLSSVLPHLRENMHKSKEDAEQDALALIRGEGKYKDAKGKPLPYAHQVDAMPPKDNKEDYAASEVTTVAFLQVNCYWQPLAPPDPDLTFVNHPSDRRGWDQRPPSCMRNTAP